MFLLIQIALYLFGVLAVALAVYDVAGRGIWRRGYYFIAVAALSYGLSCPINDLRLGIEVAPTAWSMFIMQFAFLVYLLGQLSNRED